MAASTHVPSVENNGFGRAIDRIEYGPGRMLWRRPVFKQGIAGGTEV